MCNDFLHINIVILESSDLHLLNSQRSSFIDLCINQCNCEYDKRKTDIIDTLLSNNPSKFSVQNG